MDKVVIYNRVSTAEQNPLNQLNECVELCNKLGLEDYKDYQESVSGFKETERAVFDSIKRDVEQGQIKNIVVWDLDRLYRNRKKLIAFFDLCKIKGCKIYSVRQSWLEDLNKIPSPFNEIMFNLMLQIMGWLAEEESSKKSERVKIAVRKEEGKPTRSYKGNKWGRKSISEAIKRAIMEAYKQNKTYSQICKEVFYWDKNNNKKFVSKGLIHKIISLQKYS